MTIENVQIKRIFSTLVCKATAVSSDWKRNNNIVYNCYTGEWKGDCNISDNVKKMCRREWYKVANDNGISRKELTIII